MGRIGTWVRRIVWWADGAVVLLVTLVLFFFGRQILPKLLVQPAHSMDAASAISPYARLRDFVLRETKKYLWFADPGQVMRDAHILAGRDLWSFSPIDLAPKISIPMLLMHGTADSRFSVAESRDIFREIGISSPRPVRKQMAETEGAGHKDVLSGGLPWSRKVFTAFDGFVQSLPAPSRPE